MCVCVRSVLSLKKEVKDNNVISYNVSLNKGARCSSMVERSLMV